MMCDMCKRSAIVNEKCPFRGYERLALCLECKNIERRFHRDNHVKFTPVMIVNFSMQRRSNQFGR